jgi:hypothetical protein
LLNKNGLYIKGIVYASGGSFTGSVTATSFILNDSNFTLSANKVSGLDTAISNNTIVSTAASQAASAKGVTDAFTTNGLVTNHSWGGTTWPVALTSTSNILIGARTGLYFVKPSATSATDGQAMIINDSGIAMAGSTISLDADSTISITSGATINMNASNLTIKSSPSTGENYFYVGDSGSSPSKYIKYT